MFFILSKLLPPLVAPLGLMCLAAIAALILLWKRPRWAAIVLSSGLVVLLLASSGWTCAALVRSLEMRHAPPGDIPTAEAIVVLGGATRSQRSPRPWVEVNEAGDRVLYGAKLYRENRAPLLILSGGRVEWLGGGAPESEDMAEIARSMGVPNSAMRQDPSSLNTYQNATNVRDILETEGIHRVLLITSAIHMPRSLLVFQHQNIEAIPAPTDFLFVEADIDAMSSSWQAIVLNLFPSADRLALTTRALKEYLGIFVYWLKGWL